MIVYENTLDNFIKQCTFNSISKIVANEMHKYSISFNFSQERAWTNSLPFVADALNCDEISKDINVAIEYQSQINNSRADFIVYGNDGNDKGSLVIIELKQWSKVSLSNKPNYIYAVGRGGVATDFQHPSYQSLRYSSILKGFNEYVQDNNVNVIPVHFVIIWNLFIENILMIEVNILF